MDTFIGQESVYREDMARCKCVVRRDLEVRV